MYGTITFLESNGLILRVTGIKTWMGVSFPSFTVFGKIK